MQPYDDVSLRAAAARVRALRVDDVIDLPGDLDDDEFDRLAEAVSTGDIGNPNAHDPILRAQAERLLGLLALAAEELVALLEGDLAELRAGARSHDQTRIQVLSELPPQLQPRYDAAFAKRFLGSVAGLRERLGRSAWDPPSCVAEELGLRLVLEHAEECAALFGIDLIDDWRDRLEDRLFLDMDHEFLYDPQLDGFEQDPDFLPHLRLAPMRFEVWFDPFEN